ncbi:hypothetical protein [Actinophytocola gossypii]|uniref:Transposase n=1 Tax=Actinophytocola gossypii TaxID=2812003 RepID=A0ABT2JAN6_9PSEU|nr:hypothetical protein [Actinophytocola gossypii]MCT2584823.1 hypothetical protein [Actinophytocola gossypii]
MTTPADTPLDDDERAELNWLRSENRLLRVERDILLRVASDYAHDAMTPHPNERTIR